MNERKTFITSIRITPQQVAKLRELQRQTGRNRNQLIGDLVTNAELQRPSMKPRSFLDTGKAAVK